MIMVKRRTVKISNSDILVGEKQFQERARLTLPYLVRQAKANQTIYYSDLASEINIPNPRNFNRILGAIGDALKELGTRIKIEIPPIQCIVINKRDELPGEGIGWFISPIEFGKFTKTQKQKAVSAQLINIYTFQHWDWVLEQLELAPVPTNLDKELEQAKRGRGGGESQEHKDFKEYLSKHPTALGLSNDLANGHQEYSLPSSDKVDVLFIDKDLKIGVEVKSNVSNTADILRGLFQCVKYKYLIESEQAVNGKFPNSRVILALQGTFPNKLTLVKNLLGIEVIDEIISTHK